MRGTMVETRPGKWRLRVFVGRDVDGRVRHLNRTVAGTKREAQRELAKLVADIERGALVTSHSGTVSDLVDRWLEAVALERTPYTIKEYRRLANRAIKPALGAMRLSKLTARQLDDLYTSLTARGLSAASVRRHHALLHAALGRAVKWGLLASNPADRASPPAVKRAAVRAPSVTDVQRLIKAAEDHGDSVLATAIALGAVTGCRRGELCALRWSDLDQQRGALRVARSLTVIKTTITEGPTKTHTHRYVAIDEALAALLSKRRADQETYAKEIGTVLVADAHVLSRNADGSAPCKPDGLTSAYARVARSLGQSGHFHELRHFAATMAVASGADVRTVAGRLGHADPSVTLRVYNHALEQRDPRVSGSARPDRSRHSARPRGGGGSPPNAGRAAGRRVTARGGPGRNRGPARCQAAQRLPGSSTPGVAHRCRPFRVAACSPSGAKLAVARLPGAQC